LLSVGCGGWGWCATFGFFSYPLPTCARFLRFHSFPVPGAAIVFETIGGRTTAIVPSVQRARGGSGSTNSSSSSSSSNNNKKKKGAGVATVKEEVEAEGGEGSQQRQQRQQQQRQQQPVGRKRKAGAALATEKGGLSEEGGGGKGKRGKAVSGGELGKVGRKAAAPTAHGGRRTSGRVGKGIKKKE
jgi:hypothetical protein